MNSGKTEETRISSEC